MSVSFFPTVPYPDEIGVNMSYSSFGEVRQIVAELIDKEFAGLTVLPKRGTKSRSLTARININRRQNEKFSSCG